MIQRYDNGMMEIHLTTQQKIINPFWGVEVTAIFSHKEDNVEQKLYGFYDGLNSSGEHIWKIRWTPILAGEWTCRITSKPYTEGLSQELRVHIEEKDLNKRGFLHTYPDEKWGLKFDNGEPFYLFGDTMYNIFGAYYCGVNVEDILLHRKSQGINYIRARMQVSPYHPQMRNVWQTKDCWPWGGSAQLPDFTQFNLDYFRAVDEVMFLMETLEMGLEVIFEAWMWEFPFNDRNQFIPEFEELWVRYITSRYTAYPAVYIWCPANEYEFYPSGEIKYHPEADRWLKRIAAMIRDCDPYKHPIGAHNWEKNIPLSDRLESFEDIDVYLVQTGWDVEFNKYKRDASLCMYLESQMRHHVSRGNKVAICAEFGYERVKGLFTAPAHQHLDHHHTRRGQWRAGFSGYPVIHGFDNTWGAHMQVEPDAIGAKYLIHFYRFMTEEIPFHEMTSAQMLILGASGSEEEGTLPLCLADENRSIVTVYFPTRGKCQLDLTKPEEYLATWFNPRTGEKTHTSQCSSNAFTSPDTHEGDEPYGDDWILILKK